MEKKYTDMTLPERQAAYAALQAEYESAKALIDAGATRIGASSGKKIVEGALAAND